VDGFYSAKYPELHPALARDTFATQYDLKRAPKDVIHNVVYHSLKHAYAFARVYTHDDRKALMTERALSAIREDPLDFCGLSVVGRAQDDSSSYHRSTCMGGSISCALHGFLPDLQLMYASLSAYNGR
jgi:hypothetical protein